MRAMSTSKASGALDMIAQDLELGGSTWMSARSWLERLPCSVKCLSNSVIGSGDVSCGRVLRYGNRSYKLRIT